MNLSRLPIVLVALASAVGLAGPALATQSWDGFYVGATLGYGDFSSVHCDSLCDGNLADHPTPGDSGAIFGATAGYNFTSGRLVYGFEADIMAGNLGGVSPDTNRNVGSGGDHQTDIDAFGTLRARLGLNQGTFMPYITAGVALMSVDATFVTGNPTHVLPSGTDIMTAPVAGIGAEWMLESGWSIRAEYLHVFDTDDFFYDFPDGREWCNNPGCSVTDVSMDIIRIGLNYHF